jgi:hypothetical protein
VRLSVLSRFGTLVAFSRMVICVFSISHIQWHAFLINVLVLFERCPRDRVPSSPTVARGLAFSVPIF